MAAGTTMPPSAATTGRATERRSRRSPWTTSRLISTPDEQEEHRHQRVVDPRLQRQVVEVDERRRARRAAGWPTGRSSVCDHGEFAHTIAIDGGGEHDDAAGGLVLQQPLERLHDVRGTKRSDSLQVCRIGIPPLIVRARRGASMTPRPRTLCSVSPRRATRCATRATSDLIEASVATVAGLDVRGSDRIEPDHSAVAVDEQRNHREAARRGWRPSASPTRRSPSSSSRGRRSPGVGTGSVIALSRAPGRGWGPCVAAHPRATTVRWRPLPSRRCGCAGCGPTEGPRSCRRRSCRCWRPTR